MLFKKAKGDVMATFQMLLKRSQSAPPGCYFSRCSWAFGNLTQCQTNTFLPTLLLPPFPESHTLIPGCKLIVMSP